VLGAMKLHKHGNTVSVTIPRPILCKLGWLCGRHVIVELTEDCRAVVVRLPEQRDFGVSAAPRLLVESAGAKA
jgi:antitoxin component of MazEF toxin-antitoxin module